MALSLSPPPVDLPVASSKDQRKQPHSSSSESEEPKRKKTQKKSEKVASPPPEQRLRRSKRQTSGLLQPSSSGRQSDRWNRTVYLLDKKAVGSAAASKQEMQDTFLQLMGIVEESKPAGPELDCPVTEENYCYSQLSQLAPLFPIIRKNPCDGWSIYYGTSRRNGEDEV